MLHFEAPFWLWSILLVIAFALIGISYYKPPDFKGKPLKHYMLPAILRTLAVLMVIVLIADPQIRTSEFEERKPILAVLVDNSESMRLHGMDVKALNESLYSLMASLQSKYDLRVFGIGEKVAALNDTLTFIDFQTNLSEGPQFVQQSLSLDPAWAGTLLISDGNHNRGHNPSDLLNSFKNDVFVLAVGEPASKPDLAILDAYYSPKAVVGNMAEVEWVITAQRAAGQSLEWWIETENGQHIEDGTDVLMKPNQTLRKRIFLPINKIGVQSFSLRIKALNQEVNISNNSRIIKIQGIESKEEIGVLFSEYHPDLGAFIRSVETFSTYKVSKINVSENNIAPKDLSMMLWFQPQTKYFDVYKNWLNAQKSPQTGVWIWGGDVSLASKFVQGLTFQNQKGDFDEVQAAFKKEFTLFNLSEKNQSTISNLPPVETPFGRWSLKSNVQIEMEQVLNGTPVQRPLSFVLKDATNRNWGFFVGEGLWKWRLYNFKNLQNTEAFDQWVSSWVRYLSNRPNNKRLAVEHPYLVPKDAGAEVKVRLYDASGAYSQLGNVKLEAILESGKKMEYQLQNGAQYYYLNLPTPEVGNYELRVKGKIGADIFEEKSELLVESQSLENLLVGSDTAILNSLASSGKSINWNEQNRILEQLLALDVPKTRSENVRSRSLIEWYYWFLIMLALLTGEWFLRRYSGRY